MIARAVACASAWLQLSTAAAAPSDPRPYDASAAAPWRGDASAPEVVAPEATMPSDGAGSDDAAEPAAGDTDAAEASPRPSVPPPTPVERDDRRIAVAIGLAPQAPGSAAERDLLDRLDRSARVSASPRTQVRRVRPGAGDGRSICGDHRDDLVVLIGYVPDRPEPVVLAHDCRLDLPLGVRAAAAVDEVGLIAALWEEHASAQRQGAKERRVRRLPPKARVAIAAGVTVIVVGVAIGLLVANALRKDQVVLKVSP